MPTIEQIRRVTVEGRAIGLDKLAQGLKDVAAGQNRVAAAGAAVTKSTDSTTRSVLSAERAVDRLQQRIDPAYRAQTQLERGTAMLDRALRQGAISTERHAAALAQLRARYTAVTPAATQASTAVNRSAYAASQLSYQLNDVATQLALGQSPFMVMAAQAGQISQVLGAQGGGLRGAAVTVGSAFMSMLNPINLALVAIGAAGSLAASYFSSSSSGADRLAESLKEHERILKGIRDTWGEAATAALDYQEKAKISGFETRANIADQQSILEREARQFLDKFGDIVGNDRGFRVDGGFERFGPALSRFFESVKAGAPNVERLTEEVRGLESAFPDAAREIDAAAGHVRNAAARVREAMIADTFTGPRMREPVNPPRGTNIQIPGGLVPRPRPNPDRDLGSDFDPDAAFNDLVRSGERRMRGLDQERVALGLTGEALTRYRAEMELLNAAQEEWANLTDTQRAAIEAQARAYGEAAAEIERMKKQQKDLADAAKDLKDAQTAMADSVEDIFMGFVQGGDAAKQAIMKLVAELLRAALLGEGAFKGFFKPGGLFGLGQNAGGQGGTAPVAPALGMPQGIPMPSSVTNPFSAIGSGMGIGGATGGGPAGMVAGMDVASQAWNFWASKGLAPHQVAGIMGNIRAESNFNPSAVGDGGLAHGLYQHHPARRQGIGGFLGDPMRQHELAWAELQGSESGVWRRLLAAGNVEEATAAFTGFERPQGWSLGNPQGSHGWTTRLAGAEEALSKFGSVATTATDQLGTFGGGLGELGGMLGNLGGQGGNGGFLGMLGGLFGGFGGMGSIGGLYANGGVATRPSIFGEAGPEAAVPLPDGRSIPVKMKGGRGTGDTIHIGGATINVSGNPDETTMVQLRKTIADNNRVMMRKIEERDRSRWRYD